MREKGYYWVKQDEDWIILFYNKLWYDGGVEHGNGLADSNLTQINENRIRRPDEDCDHEWQNTDVERCFVCSKCGSGMNES